MSWKQRKIKTKVACVAGVSKNLRKGIGTGRECEKQGTEEGGEESEGNACNQSQTFLFTEGPKHAALPWGANCHMRTNDN